MKKLVAAFKSELGERRLILDVGVGTARLAKPLQDAGLEVVGVDISRKMMSKARDKHAENLFLSEACSLPFKESSFEVAVCVHLLHLIAHWKMALREICRVTNDVLVSLFDARDNPVRKAYGCQLRKYGFERQRPGKSEQELKNLGVPTRLIFVSCYEVSADEHLANLAQRSSSSQWKIPQDINQKIVEELNHQFSGKKLQQELYLSIWQIEDLKDFAETIDAN
jgi:ubiquinone/menaquinone biosynthesis C-methylase UbiE